MIYLYSRMIATYIKGGLDFALKPGAAKTFQPHHSDSERYQEFTRPLLQFP